MNCYILSIEIIRTENVYSIYSIICPVLMEVNHLYLSSAATIECIQQLAQRQQAEKNLPY